MAGPENGESQVQDLPLPGSCVGNYSDQEECCTGKCIRAAECKGQTEKRKQDARKALVESRAKGAEVAVPASIKKLFAGCVVAIKEVLPHDSTRETDRRTVLCREVDGEQMDMFMVELTTGKSSGKWMVRIRSAPGWAKQFKQLPKSVGELDLTSIRDIGD